MARESYLIRDALGRMSTVVAFSERGALKIFIVKMRPARGDQVSVKLRGHGQWSTYTISG